MILLGNLADHKSMIAFGRSVGDGFQKLEIFDIVIPLH
jgi:hypothetical protein